MSIRYVGARYVPDFKGVYDPTQQYDALDIVDNGTGTSYIARKIVPPGTPLTDTDYWFVYGAASGAIIQLQNDVAQLKNDMLGVERNILIIGNSYVAYGCADLLKLAFKNSYQVVSGGVGFNTYTGTSTTFEDLLDQAIADATIPADDITDIIFVSAMGDSRAMNEGYASYITNLRTTLQSIQTKIAYNYPNCHKTSITLAEGRAVAAFSNNTYSNLFRLHQVFKKEADKYGFIYLGWSGFNSMLDPNDWNSDNYHPNTLGTLKIGTFILGSYFGHVEYKPLRGAGNVNASYASGSTFNMIWTIYPDDVTVHLRRISATNGDPITLVTGSPFIDGSAIDPPLPVPPSGESAALAIVSRSALDVKDVVVYTLTEDTNGRGAFRCDYKVATTVASSTLYPVGGNDIHYNMYASPNP